MFPLGRGSSEAGPLKPVIPAKSKIVFVWCTMSFELCSFSGSAVFAACRESENIFQVFLLQKLQGFEIFYPVGFFFSSAVQSAPTCSTLACFETLLNSNNDLHTYKWSCKIRRKQLLKSRSELNIDDCTWQKRADVQSDFVTPRDSN